MIWTKCWGESMWRQSGGCLIFCPRYVHRSVILRYVHRSVILRYVHRSVILRYVHRSVILRYVHRSMILGCVDRSVILRCVDRSVILRCVDRSVMPSYGFSVCGSETSHFRLWVGVWEGGCIGVGQISRRYSNTGNLLWSQRPDVHSEWMYDSLVCSVLLATWMVFENIEHSTWFGLLLLELARWDYKVLNAILSNFCYPSALLS